MYDEIHIEEWRNFFVKKLAKHGANKQMNKSNHSLFDKLVTYTRFFKANIHSLPPPLGWMKSYNSRENIDKPGKTNESGSKKNRRVKDTVLVESRGSEVDNTCKKIDVNVKKRHQKNDLSATPSTTTTRPLKRAKIVADKEKTEKHNTK